MRVGILGGTGPAGRALGARLAASGTQVVIGSRDPGRAEAACAQLRQRWPGRALALEGASNQEAAGADLVVLSTPWEGAEATVSALADRLEGKVVVSMVNAMAKVGQELQALALARGSVAAGVQAAAPGALVAGAFHHLPAALLADLDRRLGADVLVFSDHPRATEEASRLVGSVPGLRPLDAGGLASAGPVEAFTAVVVGLNARYRAQASVRITGIGE